MNDRSHPIELVIFDCDGVLVDSEVISARVLVRELAHYGVAIDEAHVFRCFVGQSFPRVANKIRATFQVDIPPEFESAYRRSLIAAFAQDLKLTPDVEKVLAALNSRRCVATSSSPPRAARALEICGLDATFGTNVFTASQVKNGKPAPDLFLFAAARMGIAPGACLVIEDSLAGVQAGLAAGMEVWRYIGGAHLAGMAAPDLQTPENVRVFDNWNRFFDMAPELRTQGGEDG